MCFLVIKYGLETFTSPKYVVLTTNHYSAKEFFNSQNKKVHTVAVKQKWYNLNNKV